MQLKERAKNFPVMTVPSRLRPRLAVPPKQKSACLGVQSRRADKCVIHKAEKCVSSQLKLAAQIKTVIPAPTSRVQQQVETQVRAIVQAQPTPQIQAAAGPNLPIQEDPQARSESLQPEPMDESVMVGAKLQPSQSCSPLGHPVPTTWDFRE